MSLDSLLDSETESTGSDDKYAPPTFTLHSGGQKVVKKDGRKFDAPENYDTWAIRSEDKDILDAAVQLFGGQVTEWETTRAGGLQVITTQKTLDLLVQPEGSFESDLVLWGQAGQGLLHKCNGKFYTSRGEEQGTLCGCSEFSLDEIKQRATSKEGPQPQSEIYFKLLEDPALGKGRFRNSGNKAGNWKFAALHGRVGKQVREAGVPSVIQMQKLFFEFEKDGQTISGYKVGMDYLKTYDDLNAEG